MSKSVLPVGGTTKILDGSIFFIVFFYNITDQVLKQQNILARIEYTLPFLVFGIIVFMFGNKYISAGIYYLIACGILLGLPNYSDFSSSIFFIFSFHLINKRWAFVSILITTVILLSLRLTLTQDTIPSTVLMLIIYSYVYLLYYFLIYKKPLKTIDKIDISEEEKAIVKLYCNGYTYEQIVITLGLNITGTTVRRKIRKIRDSSGCVNDVQFGKWLYKNA